MDPFEAWRKWFEEYADPEKLDGWAIHNNDLYVYFKGWQNTPIIVERAGKVWGEAEMMESLGLKFLEGEHETE